ncbi:hypothetical protein ACTFIU_003816 [Dictyostelium citrinum]
MTSLNNIEQKWDKVLEDIVDYVIGFDVEGNSKEAMETAFLALFDTIGCGFLGLKFVGCTKLMGPTIPNTRIPGGCRVPGTDYQLNPIEAAFNIGCMNRWLDFNDCWLANEWGHPSDNLASILSVAEYISNDNISKSKKPLLMKDVLCAMVKCYEIQGVLALDNSFNKIGLDHVILVKIASTAVTCYLLGGSRIQILNALSNAFIDGHPLRTYRHFPNTGSRKCWAAGDAAARAVQLSLMSMTGEMGYPTCLTAPKWGFYHVYMSDQPFQFNQRTNYSTYVMENILFKVLYPAEFHAQTAIECAILLHPIFQEKGGLNSVESITIETTEPSIRIIDKRGILRNPSDRDHCLQFMVSVALIFGELKSSHYEDQVAIKDTRIDLLREKITCIENLQFSLDYLNPDKRSVANSISILFKDGETHKHQIDYPIGHRKRRSEAIPLLKEKFLNSLNSTLFTSSSTDQIKNLFENPSKLNNLSVLDFMSIFSLSIASTPIS